MKTYKFKLHHDHGIEIIKTVSRGIVSAVNNICKAEGCPESALELIVECKK